MGKIIKHFIYIGLFVTSNLLAHCAYAQTRCYILGDSIAQGVSQYTGRCGSATQVGLNTTDARKYFTSKGKLYFDRVVISLGINDKGNNLLTLENLIAIRKNMNANKVIWILPNLYYKDQNLLVQKVASAFGDSFVDVTKVIGKDRIHPTAEGYKTIAYTLEHYL